METTCANLRNSKHELVFAGQQGPKKACADGARYLGWSYQSDVIDTRTARLHPGQERVALGGGGQGVMYCKASEFKVFSW